MNTKHSLQISFRFSRCPTCTGSMQSLQLRQWSLRVDSNYIATCTYIIWDRHHCWMSTPVHITVNYQIHTSEAHCITTAYCTRIGLQVVNLLHTARNTLLWDTKHQQVVEVIRQKGRMPMWQTDRQTHQTTRSATIGHIYVCSTAMRPHNNTW